MTDTPLKIIRDFWGNSHVAVGFETVENADHYDHLSNDLVVSLSNTLSEESSV